MTSYAQCYTLLLLAISLFTTGMTANDVPNFVSADTALKDSDFVCSSESARKLMMECAWAAPNFRHCMYQCAKPYMGLPHLTAEAMCKSFDTRIDTINCMSLCVPIDSVERKKEITGFHMCLGFPLSARQVDRFVSMLRDFRKRHNVKG